MNFIIVLYCLVTDITSYYCTGHDFTIWWIHVEMGRNQIWMMSPHKFQLFLSHHRCRVSGCQVASNAFAALHRDHEVFGNFATCYASLCTAADGLGNLGSCTKLPGCWRELFDISHKNYRDNTIAAKIWWDGKTVSFCDRAHFGYLCR